MTPEPITSSPEPVPAAVPSPIPPAAKPGAPRASRFRRIVRFARRPRVLIGLLILSIVGVLGGPHLWAYVHYKRAQRALDRYEFGVARDHLRQSLRVWDERPKVWLLAGQAARRADDFEDADRCYTRVQELLGGATDESLELEWALLRAQRGDPDPVLPYLRSLVEADHPQTLVILEAAARGYMRSYRFHDTAHLLQLWLDRRPDDVFALYHMGVTREHIGPRAEAVTAYQRVLELKPDHDEARLRLVNMFLELARPRDALDVLGPLLARRGSDPSVRVSHAQCLHGVGDRAQAERVLDELLATAPDHPAALHLRGKLAFEAEQYPRAEQLLRESIRRQPSNHDPYFTLFQVLRVRGDEEQAKIVLAQMQALEKDLRRLHTISSEELGRSPKDPRLYQELGAILLRQGETERGLTWLRDALRLDPNNAAAHQTLAEHYKKVGNEKLAAHHARLAKP